jgi:magnesium transporter
MSTDAVHAINALNNEYILHHPQEALRDLIQLSKDELAELMESLPITNSILIWDQLPLDTAASLLSDIDTKVATQCLKRGDPVHAAQVLARLPEESRTRFNNLLDKNKLREFEQLTIYPEDSAGALMDVRFVPLYEHLTVRETLHRIRRLKPKFTRQLYLLDENGKLKSMIEIHQLAMADASDVLENLVRPVPAAILATEPKELVVEQFEKFKITDLPVLSIDGRLIGIIRYDTLVTASREESSADLQTMFGASKDERALSKISFVVRKRLPWLQINLLTAFLAASVVGLFEGTIAKFTALAVLLPVVAGQSGNTGAQALAVTMRGLALREIGTSHWLRVARKELVAGFINGIVVAITTALGVLVWSNSFGLTLVIGISMVISMVMAGISGVLIPIFLSRIGQDPAQSSSIILTTVTDVVGFFTFLGIATILSSML